MHTGQNPLFLPAVSHFTNIQLTQFRNYDFRTFDFKDRVIGICGPNGSGKTNLLDAIYYLCFTRSYFSKPDARNAQNGTDGFRLEGLVANGVQQDQLVCILRETGKKEFSLNKEIYKKFSEHIGRFPCVMIAPDDAELITGGSEQRRKFIDTILSQTEPGYLKHLIDYNKILLQRNSLLKNNSADQRHTAEVLDVLDEQLINAGNPIHAIRKRFLLAFIPAVLEQYEGIAGKGEALEIQYQSPLDKGDFKALLMASREKDYFRQRTSVGIHKDELLLQMEDFAFKQLASQGQRKSLLFALKLAEYFFIGQQKRQPPMLLLDDVFEKLDADRMLNLLKKVCQQLSGQIFITDTHPERLQEAMEQLGQSHQLIQLSIP